MNRFFQPRFRFHIVDRILLFYWLLLAAALLFTVDCMWSAVGLDVICSLFWVAWHTASALFLASEKIRSNGGCWLLLLVLIVSDIGLYYVVVHENYETGSDLGGFELPRDQVAIWTFSVGLATLILGKLLIFCANQWLATKISGRIYRWFDTPAKKLGLLFASLLVVHFVLMAFGQNIGGVTHGLSIKWSALDSLDWWVMMLPTVVLLPFLMMFSKRGFFRSWGGWLLVVSYFLIVANPFLIAMWRPSYFGRDLFENNLLFFSLVLLLFLGRFWLLTRRQERDEQQEQAQWRPNLSTVLTIGIWLASALGIWHQFDLKALWNWHDSRRWHVAKFVRKFQELPNCKINVAWPDDYFDQDPDNEENEWNEKYAWLEIEFETTTQAALDQITLSSNWPNGGLLTIKNVHPELDISLLSTISYDLIFENGAIATDQLESLSGQPKSPIGGGWSSRSHPHLIDTEIIHRNGHSFVDDFSFIFSSTSDDMTRRSFDALIAANCGGFVTFQPEHQLSASTWQSLIKFTKLIRHRQTDAPEPWRNFIGIYPYLENLDQHLSWFEGVPTEVDRQLLLFMRPDPANTDLFSPSQIQTILTSNIRLQTDIASIDQHQFQSAWDFLIGPQKSPRIWMNRTMLEKQVSENNFSRAWDFHWVFSQVGSKRRTEDVTGLTLPIATDAFIQEVCARFPNLERLCIGEFVIGNVDIRDADDSLFDFEEDQLAKQTLDSLTSLKRLREVYITEPVDDLSWIGKLPSLETIAVELHNDNAWDDNSDDDFQFPESETGLKKIIFLAEEPTAALVERLEKCSSLKEIVIILNFDNENEIEQTQKRYQRLGNFTNKKVTVIDDEEWGQILPAEFQQVRKNVFEKLQQKYLSD